MSWNQGFRIGVGGREPVRGAPGGGRSVPGPEPGTRAGAGGPGGPRGRPGQPRPSSRAAIASLAALMAPLLISSVPGAFFDSKSLPL